MDESQSLSIWMSVMMTLIPAMLGVFLARKDRIKIPFRINKTSHIGYALLFGIGGGLLFFLGKWIFDPNLHFKLFNEVNTFHIFLMYFLMFFGVFFVSFLGGEILLRGYLWEKWKNYPKKQWIGIWALWVLLGISDLFFSPKIFYYTPLTCLALMPIFHLFRAKSQSIIPGTLFYATYSAFSFYLQFLSILASQ